MQTNLYELNKKQITKEVIQKMGQQFQLNVVIEELSELIKELCKYKRAILVPGSRIENIEVVTSKIVEEYIDVIISLEYLKRIYNITPELEEELTQRQLKKIKDEVLT